MLEIIAYHFYTFVNSINFKEVGEAASEEYIHRYEELYCVSRRIYLCVVYLLEQTIVINCWVEKLLLDRVHYRLKYSNANSDILGRNSLEF